MDYRYSAEESSPYSGAPEVDDERAASLHFVRMVFETFCSYGLPSSSDPTAVPSRENLGLDNFRFAKFCRDAKLMRDLGGALQTQDIDLIFLKAKTMNAKVGSPDEKAVLRQRKRKINFKEFKTALRLIAQKFNCEITSLIGINKFKAFDIILFINF